MPSLSLRLRAESMEERILHSADIAPLWLAAEPTDTVVQQPLHATATDASVQRSEIVFVDAAVPDAATLLADLQAQRSAGRPIEIVVIGAGQDGVSLISATLAARSDITAVHVLAHGSDGVLQLGSVSLDAQTLLQRGGEVAGWSAALTADADLLLYGCDVAQTALGRQFVQDLSLLSGADVAASTDLTGAAAQGGNWALEFGTGRIDAALAIDSAGQQAWAGSLAVAFTSESSGGSSTAVSSYNFSHNVNSGSDRLLMVQIVIGGATSAATSVTYNGTSLTFLAGQDSPVGTFRVESWYLLAPPVGSGSVSVVLASSSALIAGATSYSGVDQATPFGTPVTATGVNAAPSATVAASSGDLVVDIVGALGVSGHAIGAGQTQNFVQNLGSGLFDLWGVSSRENGAASVVMSESFTSVVPNWASIAVEINQVGSTAVITAAQDTYITSGSTNNYGTATGLILDAVGGGLGSGRVLLQFDLSSIPAGATITGASLQMQATANNSTPATLDIYRLTQAWVEGNGGTEAANWNDRLAGTGWTTAGGAYDPAVVATLNAPAGPGVHSWDLTALATAWFAGSIVNTGVMLASPDTGNATFTYDSSEGTTAPRLVVTYTVGNVAPTITSNGGGPNATIAVPENTTAVTTVTATDADLPAQTLSYSIVGGDDAARFTIDPVTGVLRFFVAPDFETRADVGADNVYDVIVQVSDGTLTDSQAIAVTVTNVNDNAPVSAPASATGPEDTLLTVTLSASDADSSVSSFTVQALPANGTLYLDAARTTAVVAGTAYLASSDALTLYFWPAADWNGSTSFNFFATDDLGLAGVAASASLTISAVNDAPVAADASASTGENAVLNANVPAASDVDGTVASYALASGLGAGNGSLTFNADGTYVFDPGSDFDALAAGASRDVSFTYTATDNVGLVSAPATVTLTVNGSNDAALLSADVVVLAEADSAAAISTSGVLSISDVDSPATFVAQTGTVGSYGSFSIDAAGAWTYTASSAHNEFVAGASYADSFTVSSADGTTTSVTISIVGSNDAALLSADVANLVEADSAAAISTSGTLTISDVDSAATFVAQTGTAGSYGSFAIDAAGAWTYTAASPHDAFVAGTTYTDSFTVASADGTASSVTINILGTNDAALLSADTRNLTETNAVLSAGGTLTISDVDSAATFVAQTGTAGSYGSFAIDAAGAWTYTAASAHDAFVAGTTYTDSFTVASADGTTSSVTINILGSDDAPALAATMSNQTAIQDVDFTFTVPPGSFTDADAGDTLSYSAALVSGAVLPSWLSFDAAAKTFSGTPLNADVGSITLRVTATDGSNASAVGDFTLTVANVNDVPMLTAPIADHGVVAGSPVQFQLPVATFTDIDAGDTLRYAATLADGSALPAWLNFDALTLTFTATPAADQVGAFVVRVTASDDSGAAAQALFAVIVSTPPADTVPGTIDAVEPPAAPPVEAPAGTATVPPGAAAATTQLTRLAVTAIPDALPTAPASDAPLEAQRRGVAEAADSTGARTASQSDAVLGDAIVPEYKAIDLGSMISLLSSDDLLRKLEELQRNLLEQGLERRTLVASSIAATSGLSIGYVVWLVRGGVLVSSMLSALPAWQMIDPLPVIAAAGVARVRRSKSAGDDADVERLFDDHDATRPMPAPIAAPVAAAVAERGDKRVRT